MHLPAGVFLLRMIDIVMHIALQGPIAARRVGVEPTACLHRQVGRLLHRLHGEISRRLEHGSPLAADPRDNRGPVLVIMAPAGLTLLAAPTRTASQCLFPTLLGLPLVPRGVIEVIRFHRALQPALGFVGHGRIAQPPAPAITGPAMDTQLSSNTPRRTRQTEQKGGEKPVGEEALAAVQEGAREVIAGALAALLFPAVVLQARLVV